jgi:UPF0716 protein FxsA
VRRVLAGGLFTAAVLAVVEITLLILAVRAFGAAVTLLAVLASTVVGLWLVRREGGAAWRRFRTAARDGSAPGREVTGRLAGAFGGVLLILPGFVTDLAGLFLQVPPVRRLAASGTQRLVERMLPADLAGDVFGPRTVRVRAGRPRRDDPPTGPVLEGEIVDPPGPPRP